MIDKRALLTSTNLFQAAFCRHLVDETACNKFVEANFHNCN